jgi:molybdate transport system permease protein
VSGREAGLRVLGAAGAGIAIVFLVLPVAAILLQTDPATLAGRLGEPLVLAALRLSLVTSAASTVLVVALGLPVALLLAMHSFPGKRLVETLVALPMVLPPTVAGLGLLLAFGRSGILGGAFEALGFTIPFTTLAVVLAQVFVAMPFFITTAAAGFREVDPAYLDAAATLRAGPVHRALRVLVPLSLPSLMAGAAMGWARALGEFGATITFAGNFQGRTQTLPLAVFERLQTDPGGAIAVSLLLVAVSVAVIVGLRARFLATR